VRRIRIRSRACIHCSYAHLIFADEKAAEKAYAELQGKHVSNQKLVVDYCGPKAKNKPPQMLASDAAKLPLSKMPINPTELYVGDVPHNVSKARIMSLFANATEVRLAKTPIAQRRGMHAFVLFPTAQDARAAFEQSSNLHIDGSRLEVAYARMMQKSKKRESYSAFIYTHARVCSSIGAASAVDD
jgi:RNA recognition motif-containing protein